MPGSAGPRTVTLAAIAAEAGVSVPTVSKVLNGRHDVAALTRARVEELLSHHGYLRSRTRQATGLIDLAIDNLATPWAEEILRGAVETAESADFSVAVSILPYAQPWTPWIDRILRRGSDGIAAVVKQLGRSDLRRLRAAAIPHVAVDPMGDCGPETLSVGVTNWQGGFDATRHLLDLGHSRIAAISGPPVVESARARLAGFRYAIEAAGHAVDPALVTPALFTREEGQAAAGRVLDHPHPPTAIVTGNDEQAIGAYQAAHARGVRIPDDLSVVGFDDIPISQWLDPPLTTVRQPLAAMAAAAMRMLVRQIAVGASEPSRMELATTLVVRQSTAPLRR
ncbi:LacI family DNA-binding transcriptional regulator [Actinopolymorpha sp. B9G3]|uniref:LacI family DNA-binding transcriptional regulator n=1 Tax=Actinopolymorpha sp. B9G3 TaxID=3158970 RepID=UPI0032D972FC